ncbi:MAG TPA: hypothetical protein PL009_10380 [Flavipsychrobacter sp.]|nr:hypothetical protein [Flavipsychrobacter sp.]
MLRGTEKWVTYFVLAIIFIFGIVFLAKQIGVTTDLKQTLAQAKAAGIGSGDLKKITHLHNASAKVFFLSFFSLCFLLLGIIIIMRGIQRAYDISEVQEKVRHHLKSTTPGVVLVVLGCFLLAFCTYRVSYIETIYSARLVDYNNYKIALQGGGDKKADGLMPSVDTVAFNKLKTKAKELFADVPDLPKKVADKFDKKSKEQPIVATSKSKNEPKQDKKDKNNRQHKPAAVKVKKATPSIASSTTKKPDAKKTAKVVETKYDHVKKKEEEKPQSKSSVSEQKTKQETPSNYAGKIMASDVAWAEQFQRNVTIYGYVPTSAEEARYNRIRSIYEKDNGGAINTELNWAYSFLQKTKRGYEPKPGEMRRFEEIVHRNIKSSSAASERHVKF